jgi:excisionase family DNA binding protein
MLTPQLYTIERVAELLKLHVKTVRSYVRGGKLKAKRIGKQYRITRADLEAFAGTAAIEPAAAVGRTRQVIVSSILDADAVSAQTAERISTMVMAGLRGGSAHGDSPRVDVIYYQEHAKLRVTITGSPDTAISVMRVVTALLES